MVLVVKSPLAHSLEHISLLACSVPSLNDAAWQLVLLTVFVRAILQGPESPVHNFKRLLNVSVYVRAGDVMSEILLSNC